MSSERERGREREKGLLWFCVKAFTLPVVFVPQTQTHFQDFSHIAKRALSNCKITNWDSDEIKQREAKKSLFDAAWNISTNYALTHKQTQASMKKESCCFNMLLVRKCAELGPSNSLYKPLTKQPGTCTNKPHFQMLLISYQLFNCHCSNQCDI